jgi:parallel beta-helix repeat protein
MRASRTFWLSCMFTCAVLLLSSLAQAGSADETARSTTLYVGGSGPGNYSSIQAAVDAAQPGDSIFIYDESSPYYEHVVINKNGISLNGENATATIIDGNQTGTVVTILNTSCFVFHLTIRRSGSGIMDAGIHLQHSNLTSILNLYIDNASIGIFLTDASDHAVIENCTIRDCQTAISSVATSNILINENTIKHCGNGLYCTQGTDIHIQTNIIEGDKWSGIQVDNLRTSTIIYNTITGSKYGVTAILCTGLGIGDNTITKGLWMNVWIAQSDNTSIDWNIITDSDGIGLYITGSHGTHADSNLIKGNDDGILLEYSDHSLIQDNTLNNLKNDAFFIIKTLEPHHNKWTRNYYSKPQPLPKIIQGRYKHNGHNYPLLTVDLHPLQTPQTIQHIASSHTLYVGGSGPGNYTTIQNAIDNATDGDTIFAYPGTYPGGIQANKAVTIQGADPTTTIIDSAGYDNGITITHDHCTITNLTLTAGHYGISIRNTTDATIIQNIIINNFHGINIHNTSTILITLNNLTDNQFGIRLYDSTTTTVTKNTLYNYKIDAYFIGTTPEACHNTWTRNYWKRPSLIHIIHGKYTPDDQAGSPRWNLDLHPLLRPVNP